MHSTAIIRTIVRRCIFSCFVRKRKSFIDVKFELANQFERFWFNFDLEIDRSILLAFEVLISNFYFLHSNDPWNLFFISLNFQKRKKKRKMYSRFDYKEASRAKVDIQCLPSIDRRYNKLPCEIVISF